MSTRRSNYPGNYIQQIAIVETKLEAGNTQMTYQENRKKHEHAGCFLSANEWRVNLQSCG